MRGGSTRSGWLAAAGAAAAILAVLALAGGAAARDTPPAEQAAPQPPAAPAEAPAAPAEAPRIVRVVCTDRFCGHCDGKCHRDSGHVAVDKKGHCACTPDEGGALDRATRDAYAKQQPQ